MEPVRLGLSGCGVMGGNHAEVAAASPHVELRAVADVHSLGK